MEKRPGDLLRAMPTHMAIGAALGLFTFLLLVAAGNGSVIEMIASGTNTRQTFFALAAVFAVMFAMACGLTGLLFMANEAGRD